MSTKTMSARGWLRIALVALVLVAGGASAPAQGAAAQADAFGSFRVIRQTPGRPSQPEIVLPQGYSFVSGQQYQVASRGEFYSFIKGPSSSAVPVTVRWPDVPIDSVVSLKARRTLTRNEDGSVTFSMPVTASSASGSAGTLEIFSYVHRTAGMQFRIEHRDRNRAAGYYADVPWVGAEARAALDQQFAAEAVLINSGMAAEARARGDFWGLQGFETSNRLHPDDPAHWHFSYVIRGNWSAAGTTVPHLLLDDQGRNLRNGMDVAGQGRTTYQPGEAAPVRRADGSVAATLTVRPDGGLDIAPTGANRPIYSIVTRGGDPSSGMEVRRDGEPWLWVKSFNDVEAGVVQVNKLDRTLPEDQQRWTTTRYRYDPKIGTLLGVTEG